MVRRDSQFVIVMKLDHLSINLDAKKDGKDFAHDKMEQYKV